MSLNQSERKVKRRFKEHFKTGKPLVLKENHIAVVEGRTLFPSRVFDKANRLLKSGEHSRKIGSRVVKGTWSGMPIFTLTLEERATCPRSCQHWRDCYGNHMHFAARARHGLEMEKMLGVELAFLAAEHTQGFVVRLHVLGDFYSVPYVKKWYRWMLKYPNLHVFGYTAHPTRSPIGNLMVRIHNVFPKRWWVRFSHGDTETWLSTGDSGIICPVQTGGTDCCGTCGLCWTAKKPIRFLEH